MTDPLFPQEYIEARKRWLENHGLTEEDLEFKDDNEGFHFANRTGRI